MVILTPVVGHHHSQHQRAQHQQQLSVTTPSIETTEKVLSALRQDSGTGPDMLPARILKEMAKQLAVPLRRLVLKIMWPAL